MKDEDVGTVNSGNVKLKDGQNGVFWQDAINLGMVNQYWSLII
jgi:hypothetical protein